MATDFHGFKGAAELMTEEEIAGIAASIDVDYAALRSIISVETNGSGFDDLDRPKMLFEPLHFYRNLPEAKREHAVELGLASASRPTRYPADSYPRLAQAMTIDVEAALKSASWGMGQVMGENYHLCGYASPDALVLDCMASEAKQVLVMVGYLKGDHLIAPLQAHNWTAIERGYNGKAAGGVYARKLAANFAKLDAEEAPEPDTAWMESTSLMSSVPQTGDATGGGIRVPVAPSADGTANLVGDLPHYVVSAAQTKLRALGYFSVGQPDGIIGPETIGAVASFQADNGIPTTGQLDAATLAAMDTAKSKTIAEDRLHTTIKDLRTAGSQVVKKIDNVKSTAWVQGVGGGAAAIVGGIDQWFGDAWTKLAPLREAFTSIPMWGWGLGAVGVALMTWLSGHFAQLARVDDEKVGMMTTVPGASTPAVPASTPAMHALIKASPSATPVPLANMPLVAAPAVAGADVQADGVKVGG